MLNISGKSYLYTNQYCYKFEILSLFISCLMRIKSYNIFNDKQKYVNIYL